MTSRAPRNAAKNVATKQAVTTCDVLVIGGGLMGCAAAYELSKRGLSVVVSEKNASPGTETTARSGAIIRAHYGVPQLVSLSLEANRRYANFHKKTGHDIGWTNCGYAVLVDEADVRVLEANVSMHRKLGVNVELLAPSEIKKMATALRTHDAALACYEPDGGYANPSQTVNAFAQIATQNGADFRFDAPVVAAKKRGEDWQIQLSNGDIISTPQVVICTGNWSNKVGAMFGLDLPVTPVRAQIVVMERPNSFLGSFPVISDLINLAYFREDGGDGMWVGSSDMSDLCEQLPAPENYNEQADQSAVEAARHKTALRFEGFDASDEGGIERAFCGLYETTPDWQPIVDSFQNVHVAVGFSGHGFKLAPVVGEEIAARVAGDTSSTRSEWHIFDLARFAKNRHIKSEHVYQRAKFLR